MTKKVTIDEAQSQLKNLLSLAKKGNEVIITQTDQPLARLLPIAPKVKSRIAGLNRGTMSTNNDFDAPLSDEFGLGAK